MRVVKIFALIWGLASGSIGSQISTRFEYSDLSYSGFYCDYSQLQLPSTGPGLFKVRGPFLHGVETSMPQKRDYIAPKNYAILNVSSSVSLLSKSPSFYLPCIRPFLSSRAQRFRSYRSCSGNLYPYISRRLFCPVLFKKSEHIQTKLQKSYLPRKQT